MPRYVIHIGPHKTGSTYLQLMFQRQSGALLERGIRYPLQWVAEHAPGHFPLAQRLRAGHDAALAAEFGELNDSNCETILLSAEDLSHSWSADISLLKSYLGGHEASIVFYCRRWTDLLPSAWQETVKHGQIATLPEFLTNNFVDPFASTLVNYAIVLDRFEAEFGIENIFLVSYDNVVDQGKDLGQHFFESFLSWADAPPIDRFRPNSSLGISDIEAIRAFNALELRNGGRPSAGLRVNYMGLKSTLDLAVPFAAMESNRRALQVEENSHSLAMLHEKIFQKYGQRLIPPRSGTLFFVPKAGDIQYVSQDYLLADGVSSALQLAYYQLRDASRHSLSPS